MNRTIHRGLRFSFVALGLSVAALVVSFFSVTILGMWREREQTPRLAVDSLVKGLRTYHKQTGRFPTDFRELEARVWKHKQPPDLGVDGRNLSVANYLDRYYPVDAASATIWIIPIGPQREKGSTHFLLLKPTSLRRWKGAPLSLEGIKNIPPVPQYGQMANFGMVEQGSIHLSGRK